MIEKCKQYLKNTFSNGPKAKMIIGLAVAGIITVTFVNMRKTIEISIDGNKETFVTYKGTVKNILQSKGVEIAPKDKVEPALNDKVSENDTINIKKAIQVKLTVVDKEIAIDTAEETVADMIKAESNELKNQGIEFKEGLDEITPALETKLEKDMNIQLVKVDIKEEIAKEVLAYDTSEQNDEDLDSSVTEIRQGGIPGEKEVIYEVIFKNGKEVARNVKASKVTVTPVTQITVVGTKVQLASASRGSQALGNIIYCESTAYSGGGRTATGTVPVSARGGRGTIAVDPRVIPLGSLVYVEGYGEAIAADTGGAIKGNIVDIYVDSDQEAINWGRRYNVAVSIIAYPGEW
ncbi:MAG: 3D domain-containing protein [Clostridium sp.]